MTVTTKKKRARPAGGGGAAANGAAPASSHFVCSVCSAKRQNLTSAGANNFIAAPNGTRICMGCVRTREHEDLRAGRITLGVEYDAAKRGWYAVSASGKERIPLIRGDGENDGQVIFNPRFMLEGVVWSGRLYKTGMVAFQKTKAVATRPARTRAAKPKGDAAVATATT